MPSLRGTPLPRCELVIAIEDNSSLYLTYYCAIYGQIILLIANWHYWQLVV